MALMKSFLLICSTSSACPVELFIVFNGISILEEAEEEEYSEEEAAEQELGEEYSEEEASEEEPSEEYEESDEVQEAAEEVFGESDDECLDDFSIEEIKESVQEE